MADAAVCAFGRLDVLVNNAGTTSFIPHDELEKVTEEDWEKILGVNLRGPFQCARAAPRGCGKRQAARRCPTVFRGSSCAT